jgi:hypothetical protein
MRAPAPRERAYSCTSIQFSATPHPPSKSFFKTANEHEAKALKLPCPGDLKARRAALAEKGKVKLDRRWCLQMCSHSTSTTIHIALTQPRATARPAQSSSCASWPTTRCTIGRRSATNCSKTFWKTVIHHCKPRPKPYLLPTLVIVLNSLIGSASCYMLYLITSTVYHAPLHLELHQLPTLACNPRPPSTISRENQGGAAVRSVHGGAKARSGQRVRGQVAFTSR